MKVLFDTCIILDAMQAREPWRKEAEQLFLLVADDRVDGYITPKAATDIYYMLRKTFQEEQMARKKLSDLFSLFALLDTRKEDVLDALASRQRDYEDAVMVATARRADMDCICTRNIADFGSAGLPIVTPNECIETVVDCCFSGPKR